MNIISQVGRYPLLQVPTLVIVGEKDHTVPLASYALAEARAKMGNFMELGRAAEKDIPHATLVVVYRGFADG